jgi:lactoylglutathione lyase
VQDVYKTGDQVKAAGGNVLRDPGPVPGIGTKILAITDPGGLGCSGCGLRM